MTGACQGQEIVLPDGFEAAQQVDAIEIFAQHGVDNGNIEGVTEGKGDGFCSGREGGDGVVGAEEFLDDVTIFFQIIDHEYVHTELFTRAKVCGLREVDVKQV